MNRDVIKYALFVEDDNSSSALLTNAGQLGWHRHHMPIIRTRCRSRITSEGHEGYLWRTVLRHGGLPHVVLVRNVAVRLLTATQTEVGIGAVVVSDVGVAVMVA